MNLDNAIPVITAIVGAVASYIVFINKFNFDKSRAHREIASEKLITIINHMVLFLTIEKDTMIIDNKELYDKFKSHGSCLPSGIYNNILKLIEYESKSTDDNNCFNNPSYKLLRDQILSKVRLEQSELTVIYDNSFEKFKDQTILYRNKPFSLLISKVSNQVSIILIILITYLLILIYSDFNVELSFGEKIVVIGCMIMILSLAYFCVMCFALSFAKFYDRLIREFSKGIRIYNPDDIVKKSGWYKCAICGKIEEQHADTYFTFCRHDNMSFLKLLFKTTFLISYWKFEYDNVNRAS